MILPSLPQLPGLRTRPGPGLPRAGPGLGASSWGAGRGSSQGRGLALGPAGLPRASGRRIVETEGAKAQVGRVRRRLGRAEARGGGGGGSAGPGSSQRPGSAAALGPRRPLPAPAPSVVPRSSFLRLFSGSEPDTAAAARARHRLLGSAPRALGWRGAATDPVALEEERGSWHAPGLQRCAR